MCGIIGYIGDKPVVPVLIEGLRRLEIPEAMQKKFGSAPLGVQFEMPFTVDGLLDHVRSVLDG